jgi:hypothetical protein
MHAGSPLKQLEPYSPTAQRSRLESVDLPSVFKYSSNISLNDGTL